MATGDPIEVARRADGAVCYHLPFAASDLPPVFTRDLSRAWDAARDAALAGRTGAVRLFRFAGNGDVLALSDRDARSWAEAVDRSTGLGTAYGVSVLLRLLSLLDFLSRASHGTNPRRCRTLQPSLTLLRAAAACPLSAGARLDEAPLRHALAPTGVPA